VAAAHPSNPLRAQTLRVCDGCAIRFQAKRDETVFSLGYFIGFAYFTESCHPFREGDYQIANYFFSYIQKAYLKYLRRKMEKESRNYSVACGTPGVVRELVSAFLGRLLCRRIRRCYTQTDPPSAAKPAPFERAARPRAWCKSTKRPANYVVPKKNPEFCGTGIFQYLFKKSSYCE
jgi:hypothetical protein